MLWCAGSVFIQLFLVYWMVIEFQLFTLIMQTWVIFVRNNLTLKHVERRWDLIHRCCCVFWLCSPINTTKTCSLIDFHTDIWTAVTHTWTTAHPKPLCCKCWNVKSCTPFACIYFNKNSNQMQCVVLIFVLTTKNTCMAFILGSSPQIYFKFFLKNCEDEGGCTWTLKNYLAGMYKFQNNTNRMNTLGLEGKSGH
jgi:hypothetical protein